MYKCSVCFIDKERTEYYFDKKGRRVRPCCKSCWKIQYQEYKAKNKEKIKEQQRKSNQKRTCKKPDNFPMEKICSKCKVLQSINSYHYDKHMENYKSNCKECVKTYRINTRDVTNEYIRKKCAEDINFRIKRNLSRRIHIAIKTNKLNTKSLSLIQCDMDFLSSWLEFQFTPYINFSNYGTYWHIDHYIPCSSYNLENNVDQLECFHWSNLQPLEASSNLRKSNKIPVNARLFRELKMRVFILSRKGLDTAVFEKS